MYFFIAALIVKSHLLTFQLFFDSVSRAKDRIRAEEIAYQQQFSKMELKKVCNSINTINIGILVVVVAEWAWDAFYRRCDILA